MEWLITILTFIKEVVLATSFGLFYLFGGLIIFGITLYFLARLTRNSFARSIGSKFEHYSTAWIGTPIHELGHAFFCLIFGHKITSIRLFIPNPKDTTLGYVNHAYNSRNLWHRIGNFFIGIGPILFGSGLLFLLFKYLLFPEGASLSFQNSMDNQHLAFAEIMNEALSFMKLLFTHENLSRWQFWVFLYLAFAISTHMELSPADLKGALSGFISLCITTLVIYGIMKGFSFSFSVLPYIAPYIALLNATLFLATVLSFIFFSTSFIILNLYSILFKNYFFHPFG